MKAKLIFVWLTINVYLYFPVAWLFYILKFMVYKSANVCSKHSAYIKSLSDKIKNYDIS